jgi:hypothetical protein
MRASAWADVGGYYTTGSLKTRLKTGRKKRAGERQIRTVA